MNKRHFTALMCVCWMLSCLDQTVAAQGQATLDSLLKQVPRSKGDTNKVILLSKISTAYATQDPAVGLKYGQEATALALNLRWDKGTAIAYNALGNNHISASSFDSAIYYLQKSMSVNNRIGYKQGTAQNLGNLGIIAYNQGNMSQTLEYFFKALKIFEELEDKMGVATQLCNIGTIYQQRNEYDKALKYDTLALRQYEEMGDKGGTAIQLGNIGNVYAAMDKQALAAEYDLASYELYKSLGNRTGIVRSLVNLSQVYGKMNDDAKAYEALVEAIAIEKELGGKNELATCYVNLGTIYLTRGTDTVTKPPVKGIPASKAACLALAVNYLQKGIEFFTQAGNYSNLAYAYKMLSNAYAQQNNYKEALKAFQSFQQVNDSAFTIDNNLKIATLETQRAIDLKNKQIALDELAVEKKRNERGFFAIGMIVLFVVIGVIFRNYRTQKGLNGALHIEKQKVEERTVALDDTNKELNITLTNLRETQEQLIVAEKQKENQLIRSRISQDIHDDISSELTRISWVSELVKTKMKKEDYKDMPNLLEKITDSSRETVSKLGEIIWTVNPQNDTLASLLIYMRSHINKFFADTAFILKIDFPEQGTNRPIHPELKRNLYLVMKEALNNAVKYSGAETITISFSLDGNSFQFCIQDDGKGMTEGVIEGSGNGVINMKRRMENVHGRLTIASEPAHGTSICCEGELYS